MKEERLRKGQNQLIIEKWQKKFEKKRSSMSKTGNIKMTLAYNKPTKSFFPKIERFDSRKSNNECLTTPIQSNRNLNVYETDGIVTKHNYLESSLRREFSDTLRNFVEKKNITDNDDILVEELKEKLQMKHQAKEAVEHEDQSYREVTESAKEEFNDNVKIRKPSVSNNINTLKTKDVDFEEDKIQNENNDKDKEYNKITEMTEDKEDKEEREDKVSSGGEDTKSNLDEFESNNKPFNYNTNANFYKTGSGPQNPNYDVPSIMRRILEKNKQEMNARNNEIPIPQSYMNLNTRPNSRAAFIGCNSRPMTETLKNKFDTPNHMELSLSDYLAWRKHEELWVNVVSPSYMPSELEKYLIPPNDFDTLVSCFCKVHGVSSNIILSDNTNNPREELKKWKHAYKKVVMRWHPDKLFPLLESIKFIDEGKRQVIKKKSSVIINNMNKQFKNICEILKKISLKKEESK
jgi:hypothetical protein